MAVDGLAVGVAAELSVVRQPRVRRFDDPPLPEPHRLVLAWFFGAAALDVEIVEAEGCEARAYDRVVVAAVEVQRLDVAEQAGGVDGLDGRLQQADVVAVRAVDRPADRDAVTVRRD